jgi:PKHD-type hydroxylase
MSQGFLHIPGLLRADEVARIESLTADAIFVDGKTTASSPASDVKSNWQVKAGSEPLTTVQATLTDALASSPLFTVAALPKTIYPFVISKYTPGNAYGWHVDSPTMGDPPLRTDLAMTIFLSDPASYEGGELIIQGDNGPAAFKPARGDAVLYPCQYLHCVNEVTQGSRLAAVTWIQSNVKNAEQRQMLFQLKQVHGLLSQKSPTAPETALLLQTHANLFRMWADL